MLRHLTSLSLLVLLGAALAGCVQTLDDIDQRQPHALDKSLFEGEWYFRHYIADVSSLAAEDFGYIPKVGMHPARIRWEIHEDELTAISVVETLPGREGLAPDEELEETIVARYPILSHFDQRRQFDPQTGEESNVLIEDTTTRKWYERDYIRVDWSQNLAQHWLFELFDSVDARPVVTEGDDDARFVLDVGEDHLNVVTEHTTNVEDVLSSRVTIVTSAARVPDRDYEPLEVPYQQQVVDAAGQPVFDERGDPRYVAVGSRFGILNTERQIYDRNDGELWSKRQYLANRHNLWQRWHDDAGNEIPLAEREIRPILYVLNDDFPAEYLPSARVLADVWNQAFVQVLTEVGYPADRIGRVFDVCENPITEAASPECQTLGLGRKTIGDVRYHFMNVHRGSGFGGLLGVAQTHPDPETGESIASTASGFSDTFQSVAKQALDMVKALQGVLDPESPEWAHGTVFGTLGGSTRESGERVDARNTGAEQWLEQVRPALGRDGSEPAGAPHAGAWRELLDDSLRGRSAVELSLRSLMEHEPHGDEALDETTEIGRSPLSLREAVQAWRSPRRSDETLAEHLARKERGMRMMSRNHALVSEYINPTMTFLAERMARRHPYPERGTPDYDARVREIDEQVLAELEHSVFMATMLHEVGHALGLDHNFKGNFDEHNFVHPGVTTPVVSELLTPGAGDDGPTGYWDVATTPEDDLAARAEFQYSSIMDYAGSIAGDIRGLGAYDLAAIRFAYLGHVEIYESGHPALAERDAAAAGAPRYQRAQAAFEVIQRRRFVPFDPNAIEVDSASGLEFVRDGGAIRYLNRYEFCNDTFANGFDLECTQHDVGRDLLESVSVGLDIARQNYVFTNLTRGRRVNTGGLSFGVILRTFQNLQSAVRAGQLASFYSQLFGLTPDLVFSSDDWGFIGEYYRIAAYGMNEIVNILNTPTPAEYVWSGPELMPSPYLPGRSPIPVMSMAEGDYVRPLDSDYARTPGEWSEVAQHGYYNNRIGAILALVLGLNLELEEVVQSSLPPELGALSLANVFPGETLELLYETLTANTSTTQEYIFPSVIHRHPSRYSPLPVREAGLLASAADVSAPGGVATSVMPSNRILMDVARAGGSPLPLESQLTSQYGDWESVPKVYALNQGEELQWFLQLAMSELPSVNDRSWQRWLRVTQRGDVFSRDFPAPEEGGVSRVVEWTDTGTGITWQAYRYDPVVAIDGAEIDPSLGARFLTWVTDTLAELPPEAHDAFLDEVRYKLDLWYSFQRL